MFIKYSINKYQISGVTGSHASPHHKPIHFRVPLFDVNVEFRISYLVFSTHNFDHPSQKR